MSESYRVALIRWGHNGLGEPVYEELINLGHDPVYFEFDGTVPTAVDVVFLYGPFGKYMPILQQLSRLPQRPTTVFWNTEGLPDLRLPWLVMATTSHLRSWLGRFDGLEAAAWQQRFAQTRPFSLIDDRMIRFRYLGDFFYAYRQGWLDVFFDISAVYANFFNKHDLPTKVAPFGSFAAWHQDLGLERDIDVLWMGKRGTSRRGQMLDDLRAELQKRGTDIYMVDGEERPFIYGEERTQILNRTKITLNLLRTWYDENSLRICMAAPNRSLFLTEPLLPHVPQYKAGTHYVAATIEEMADTIMYYLEHEAERQQIVENAYQLLMTDVTMYNSVQHIMEAVQQHRAQTVTYRK